MAEKDPRFYQAVGDHIARHGVVAKAEEVTRDAFEEKVTAFQEAKKIFVDGKVGPITLWTLQYEFALADKKLKFTRVRADKPPSGYEGYGGLRLREDAAAAFDRLAGRVRALGGIVTTSGGVRDMNVKPDANQSATSFHYTGLAFDLAVSTGSFNLERDPYLIEWSSQTNRWIVWARAEGGEERTIEATLHAGPWTNLQVTRQSVAGRFVNVTEIAATEGFQPIGPRPRYTRSENKAYLSSEWWHFQYEAALTPNFSQFGIELLRLQGYDSVLRALARAMEPNGVWQKRMFVFNENWN